MHMTWCSVHVLRVYGECVVVTIRCKLLQCSVHVYSVMYINGIWTWIYIIHMGEREREREREREIERERDVLYMYITCWPRSLLTTLDFSKSDILPSIIFSTSAGTYCIVTIMTSTVDIHSYTSSISLIQSLILSNDL